ncbi:hypothetical protein Tco_1236282 [Tanacetum coccineum]
MGDENPIRTLRDYSRPSHEGYRNTIELSDGNNLVPLRSDTIRLVKNGCLFHELRSEDLNQHIKDFLNLADSLDLDVANRKRTRLRLFQFSLRGQASNWLERLPAGSISTWENLTTLDRNLRELSGEVAWEAIDDFAQGQKEWDNPPNIIFEQELANLRAQAKRLFGDEKVLVEMHRCEEAKAKKNSISQSSLELSARS